MKTILETAMLLNDKLFGGHKTVGATKVPPKMYEPKEMHTYHLKGYEIVATSKKAAIKKLAHMGLTSKRR